MTYKLWDKKTDIYDVSPEQAMANNSKYRDEDSYLFIRDDGSILDILPISEIPNPDDLIDADEICKAYIKSLTEIPKDEPNPDIETLQSQISDLKKQNSLLEDCIIELAQIVYA